MTTQHPGQFVVPTLRRHPTLFATTSAELRIARRMILTANPASAVLSGVDGTPVDGSSSLDGIAGATSLGGDTEPTDVHGRDALLVRGEEEVDGVTWSTVDLVWVSEDVAWHAWVAAPSITGGRRGTSLEELVRRSAEATETPQDPPAARWSSATDVWRRVTL